MSMEAKLPINDQILTSLKEAIIFVRENGDIIRGNDAAYSLLNIDEENERSIYQYLDFGLLQKKDETHLLMEIKNQRGKLAEVKAIRTGNDIFCLMISELSINDKTDEVKRYINNQVYADSEGTVMYEADRIIDCDQTFADMFGYTEKEIKNMPFSQLVDSKSFHKLSDIHHYPDRPHELIGVRKDQSVFYFEMMGHPYNNVGNIVSVAIKIGRASC